MLTEPQPTFTQIGMPDKALGTLPTTDPTVLNDALGRAKDGGRVMVEVNAACTITLRVYSDISKAWRFPSSSSASYQKTFAADGMDYFDIPPGAYFHLKASIGSITAWADCLPKQQGIF